MTTPNPGAAASEREARAKETDRSIEAIRERAAESIIWSPDEGPVPQHVSTALWAAVRDREALLAILAAHPTPPPTLDAQWVERMRRLDVFAAEAMSVGWYDAGTFRAIIDGDDDRVFEDTDAVFLAAVTPQVVRRLIAAVLSPAATPSPDAGEPQSLDTAWREAEDALPEGWYFTGGSRGHDGYRFTAMLGSAPTEAELRQSPILAAFGPTAAAALQALAAKLRLESPESGT